MSIGRRIWLAVATTLVLVTAVPSWAGASSQEALAWALQNLGPAYHLGAGRFDSDLSLGDFRLRDPATELVGASGTAAATPAVPEGQDESASELNRKLTNPVSTIWSLSNQFNNYKLENGHWSNNWNFQPVLPVSLTKDLNLITRPVIPLYNIVPHETAPGEFERTLGLGDMVLLELLSPANTGNWLLGAGPTFIFPTATSKFTGQGKVQAGPQRPGGLPHKGVHPRPVPPAVVLHRRRSQPAGHEPDEPPADRVCLLRGRLEYRLLGQHSRGLEGPVGGCLDGSCRPRGLQGSEAWASAGQAPAIAAVHACPPPQLRPGVERPGPGDPGPAEAHQGHPLRVTEGSITASLLRERPVGAIFAVESWSPAGFRLTSTYRSVFLLGCDPLELVGTHEGQ